MRLLVYGAAAALVIGLTGCCTTGGSSGGFVHKSCASSQPLGAGGPGAVNVSDVIDDTAALGQPIILKPEYQTVPGACFDSVNGDINVYGVNATSVSFTVTFNPSLVGKVAWPSSPQDAVQVGPVGGGPVGPWPWPSQPPQFQSTAQGQAVEFTVPYEGPGTIRRYQFQYIVPGPPPNTLHVVEPMIRNH